MGVFDKDLFGKSKHETAIARIRTFCEGKRTLVAFSGGKDSQCCYHLCQEAGIEFTAQYSVTQFEPPELLRFIRDNYPKIEWRKPAKTLVEKIGAHGLPCRWARWCCDAKHKKTPGFEIAVIGVRAEESPKRAATWRVFGFKPDHSAYICPIIDWKTEDVWEYLAARSIPHCCLYDPPFNQRRIGCVCCPLTPRLMLKQALIWPKTAAMLKIGARKFVERMKNDGFVTKRGNPCADWCKAEDPLEEYWRRWVNSGQTSMPIDAVADDSEEQCLFAGTGFSESDGAGEADEP